MLNTFDIEHVRHSGSDPKVRNFPMFMLLLIPLAAGLIAMPIVKRAPVHGALLAAWTALTFLIFVPGGFLMGSAYFDDNLLGGGLVALVSASGLVASVHMLRRLSGLYRGETLGGSKYLVGHHAAVVIAFFVAELSVGRGFGLTTFCLIACGVGALIVGYDKAKLPAPKPQPVAF
ncbi:MAG: hypothetical protein ACI9KE_002243 [Polyangiales bacterium]|jgi:hypothetical protein